MGIFDWLWQAKFTRFDDCFAISQKAIWPRLKEVVERNQVEEHKSVWMVAHFLSRFEELQSQLERWDTNYDVVTTPIELEKLPRSSLLETGSVKLVLANLIPNLPTASLEPDLDHTLAIMVVDRHPLMEHDQKILEFAERCPYRSELGYFLALDDAVLKLVVNETTIQILEQLGLGENDLISSRMVSRRVDKVLRRMSASFRGDGLAESPEEWLTQFG